MFNSIGGVERHLEFRQDLGTEAVEGLALAFEGIHNVESSDGLSAGMLRVSDTVLDHVLEEGLEDTTGFLVHETGNALDTSSTSQTSNGRLGDALNVFAHDLTMTLGASFTFSFMRTRHV